MVVERDSGRSKRGGSEVWLGEAWLPLDGRLFLLRQLGLGLGPVFNVLLELAGNLGGEVGNLDRSSSGKQVVTRLADDFLGPWYELRSQV